MGHRFHWLILICGLFCMPFGLKAQQKAITELYINEMEALREAHSGRFSLSNDENIDILFYHLKLKPAIDSAWIEGSVAIRFRSVTENLTTIKLDLQRNLLVDSIVGAASFLQANDSLHIRLTHTVQIDSIFSVEIFYKGSPQLAAGIKGLKYATHGQNEPVIATLSTPFLAHYWFPCKDGPHDKADSVYVDITIPYRYYNNLMLKAVSNGMLEITENNGHWQTFRWRHRYPIVSYYVMMAISNYVLLEEEYCSHDHCFPLQYYVFATDSANAREGVAELPAMMALFEKLFGPYPFRNEKYGMTQLGFYGAIENQTNSIINQMGPDWKMVVVHELAHMWFGCNITCSDWSHGWLNEGFATYCEALWQEHRYGANAYAAYMSQKGWYQGGTVHLSGTDDPLGIFIGIIYNKGAWVLHMLRAVMGDELFFAFLKDYASLPELQFGHVSTEDFRALAEAAYNDDLSFFFDQWVYDEYYPSYLYNYQQNGNRLSIQLYQMQAQMGRRPLFIAPLQLLVSFSDFTDTLITVWNDQQHQLVNLIVSKTVAGITLDPFQWLLHTATFHPDLPVGVLPEIRNERFVFGPNPASNYLLIRIEDDTVFPVTFQIKDARGTLRKSWELRSHYEIIDIQLLNPGVYFLRAVGEKGPLGRWRKLIIQ